MYMCIAFYFYIKGALIKIFDKIEDSSNIIGTFLTLKLSLLPVSLFLFNIFYSNNFPIINLKSSFSAVKFPLLSYPFPILIYFPPNKKVGIEPFGLYFL